MAKRHKKGKTKSKSKRGRNFLVSVGRSPIAKQALVSLRYCDTVTINASAGVTATHVFRANSIYDPDHTTSVLDHKPLGSTEWGTFYDNYCVLGAKLNVMPVNLQTAIPIQFGIVLRHGGISSAVNPNLLKEQGDSTWAYAGNMNNMRQRSITKKVSIAKFTGYKNPNNENVLRASMGANPEEVVYFQIWCASADQSTDPAAVSFNITLDYITLLSMPKKLPQS